MHDASFLFESLPNSTDQYEEVAKCNLTMNGRLRSLGRIECRLMRGGLKGRDDL